MAKGRITKRSVDTLVTTGADTFLWDPDLRGFGLKATRGGTNTYLVQYRMAGRGSKTQRCTIGTHGTWTPATAREEAEKLLRLVATGIDPRAKAKEAAEAAAGQLPGPEPAPDFAEYAGAFLTKYGRQAWRPRIFASNESNMRRHQLLNKPRQRWRFGVDVHRAIVASFPRARHEAGRSR